MKPLLIEIGCEELPPKALDDLSKSFADGLATEFSALHFVSGEMQTLASPRRLAVLFQGVPPAAEKLRTQVKAVPVRVGWDAAQQPTAALIKKAAQLGIAPDAFKPDGDGDNAMLVCDTHVGGDALRDLVGGVIERALKRLPIPKPMRWGDHDYSFVRPLHWLVILHGDDVIDTQIMGITSGRESRGHRFHHPHPVSIASPAHYVAALRSANVLADPAERRARVRSEVETVARQISAKPRLRNELLDEIANLTEWPMAIACRFEREFLRVPQEALIQTMETNQKFVPVFDADGKLTEHFIGIANIESKDPSEIRKGYERVIRPRFADAKFFFDDDSKSPLASHQEGLKSLTYQQSLGSVWDKCVRVAELARVIANRVGVDAASATRAAALSKCDLMTRMVGEFPELQGVMGRYYASQGTPPESGEVAQALDEFYRPRFAGDGIAQGRLSQVLAVAERLDTLAGIFAVGAKPSGNKDPFALRRAALGLARTLIEGALDIDLKAHLIEALALVPEAALTAGLPKPKDGKPANLDAGVRREQLAAELYEFVLERLRSYYADQGIRSEMFDAIRAVAPGDLCDFDRRLRAVVEFSTLPQAQALAAANKRIGNILRQAKQDSATQIDATLLDAGAESQLAASIDAAATAIAPLRAHGDYVAMLRMLATLREPIDLFFDEVMVMDENLAKRRNRLALLDRMHRMFLDIADISLLPSV